MPNYDYRCPDCGHEYTKFQKITDESRAECPNCGTPGDRVISGGAGLIFKGSGFYVTDYARAGEKAKEKEPTAASDSAKSTGDKKKKDSPKEPSKTVKASKPGDGS
jgi:putative FmdB family regulatory protein